MDLEQELSKILAKIGLTARERQVFLELANIGPSTLKELILKTKLKKPTVYRVVVDLEAKGLIFSDNKKYEKHYTAHEPKRIQAQLGNEQRKMRRLELEFAELLPQLNAMFRSGGGKPKVEIYQTKEGYEALSNQSLECSEKVIYYLGNIENILEVLGEEYDREYYIPTRLKRGVAYRLLTLDTPLMREYRKRDANQNRETRFLPKEMSMDTTIMIFNNTVAFFSEAKEMLALAITSASIAKTVKFIFQDLWSHAE